MVTGTATENTGSQAVRCHPRPPRVPALRALLVTGSVPMAPSPFLEASSVCPLKRPITAPPRCSGWGGRAQGGGSRAPAGGEPSHLLPVTGCEKPVSLLPWGWRSPCGGESPASCSLTAQGQALASSTEASGSCPGSRGAVAVQA